ncbi:MAG: hypothetical protein OXQ31_14980 [Spirochaetaceae bacterium]|nr:hypothetical protein [Spirochaetaceae bacterium]
MIKSAVRPPDARTAAALLAAIRRMPVMPDADLDLLDSAQRADPPPPDRWRAK